MVVMAGRKPILALATGWNKWTIIRVWPASPVPGPGVTRGMPVPWAIFHLEVTHQLWASLLGCQPWLCLSLAVWPGHGTLVLHSVH